MEKRSPSSAAKLNLTKKLLCKYVMSYEQLYICLSYLNEYIEKATTGTFKLNFSTSHGTRIRSSNKKHSQLTCVTYKNLSYLSSWKKQQVENGTVSGMVSILCTIPVNSDVLFSKYPLLTSFYHLIWPSLIQWNVKERMKIQSPNSFNAFFLCEWIILIPLC